MQCLVPTDEWENFLTALKQPLPCTFRITGYVRYTFLIVFMFWFLSFITYLLKSLNKVFELFFECEQDQYIEFFMHQGWNYSRRHHGNSRLLKNSAIFVI